MKLTRAFTLIELLVVISIIAVLAAMLLPAVSMVRDAARASNCRANEHQFGLAFDSYLNDNQGNYPGGSWQQAIQDYINVDGKQIQIVVDGTDTTVSYKPARCPAAPALNAAGKTLGVTYSYTGHYYNSWAGGKIFWAWYVLLENNSYPPWGKAPTINQAQIVNVSQKCYLSEYWDDTARQNWGISQLNAENIMKVHKDRSNILLADGHVQSVSVTTTGALKYANWNDSLWLPKSTAASLRVQ